jgi:DNA sulfur modification protein DndD
VIFRRIEMENFGIFYGAQVLDLEPGLYVVHGENGRGKTTIINAVKWTFFGRFQDRQGRVIDPKGILNRDAKREGATKFSVAMTLVDDQGVETLARRTCEVGAGDVSVSLYVERGGQPLTQAESEHALRNFLEENVSRFFLFDGEQLREYEELLFDEDEATQSKLVKRSIEQILGLPVLEHAIADLDAVGKEIQKRIAKLARSTAKTQRLSQQVEQLETEVAEAKKDLEGLEGLRDAEQEKANEAAAVLQENEAAQDLVKQMEAVEIEMENLASSREERVGDRAAALAGSWQDALAIAVAPRRKALEGEVEAREAAEREAFAAAQIERSLAEGNCDLCGQDFGQETGERLRASLDGFGSATNGGGSLDPRQDLASLLRIAGTGAIERAVTLDERISDADTKRVSKEQELAQIREAIGSAPTEDIRQAGERHKKSLEEIGGLKKSIGEKEEGIAKKERQRQELVHQITSSSDDGEMTALKESENLAAGLSGLFEQAQGGFRDNLRGQVERDASEIFARLTTDSTHTGLRINAGYGLETIGPAGEVVPGRSAGQEQIVALSLIGALNRNAARRAPVMMDTPFGRLDKGHRANVLAFLSEMAEQVFLLVHSAEVDPDDLEAVASDVEAELTLKRESTFRTEIRPYEGNP